MSIVNRSTPRSQLISMFTGYPEHMAVVNDDIAALDAALAAADGDCDVLYHTALHDTPLVLAIQLGRVRMIEHLIAVGVNVNLVAPGFLRRTPASVAAEVADERVMTMLIQAGANLHEHGYFFQTLCHCAARNADASVLRVLLEAGASFDEESENYGRPIHMAVANENEQVLAILLAKNVSLHGGDDVTIFQFASSNRNEKVLAMLMKAGADIKSRDKYGYYPIHYAARNPNVAVVRLLIDAGVDVNVLDNDGENPLFDACENPNAEVLDALVAAGAEWVDVSKRRTFCHAVAQNTNEAIVRRVIERGVDVNARDSGGLTPLMIAAQSSTAAVVSIFLEAGADVHATDKEQKTACYYACWNKNVGIVRVLIAAGARFEVVDLLKAAITTANIDTVQALIDAGMNVANEINSDPSLLFTLSTWRPRKPELLELLIRRGVDFRVVHKGQTLCHTANEGCLAVLFAHGADLNAKGSDGRTPIQVARTDEISTFIAAGIDAARPYALGGSSFLAAVDHPEVPVDSVPRRELAWACNRVAERQFDLLRLRAFQVCVGLEGRQLPALVTCEILAHAFAPLESLVAFHRVWEIVTTIKHFHSK